MRISSLDPGFNTGVAIANLHEGVQKIVLVKYFLGTIIDEPLTVARLVLASRSQICLMERKPRNVETSDNVPNEKIKVLLETIILQEIGPGTWKPFMASRLAELEPWKPETQHEKDSMAILFYYVQILYPGRKVLYV